MSLQIVPYILMNGRAKEAIEYYKEALNANVLFQQTFGEGPKDTLGMVKENELDFIAHSVLRIGETKIMIADIIPEFQITNGNQISICITTSDILEAKKLFENLKKDGKVIIELNKVHFSPAWGMVIDKFGITFQIYTNRM